VEVVDTQELDRDGVRRASILGRARVGGRRVDGHRARIALGSIVASATDR